MWCLHLYTLPIFPYNLETCSNTHRKMVSSPNCENKGKATWVSFLWEKKASDMLCYDHFVKFIS